MRKIRKTLHVKARKNSAGGKFGMWWLDDELAWQIDI